MPLPSPLQILHSSPKMRDSLNFVALLTSPWSQPCLGLPSTVSDFRIDCVFADLRDEAL